MLIAVYILCEDSCGSGTHGWGTNIMKGKGVRERANRGMSSREVRKGRPNQLIMGRIVVRTVVAMVWGMMWCLWQVISSGDLAISYELLYQLYWVWSNGSVCSVVSACDLRM